MTEGAPGHQAGDTRTEPLSSAGAPPGVAGPRVALLVYDRDGAAVAVLEPGVPLVVGRGRPSHLCVADATLSREHARFTLAEGRVTVEDLGSRNGTWLDGVRVRWAELGVGDELMLGGLIARVQALGASPAGAPSPPAAPRPRARDEAIVAGPAMSALVEAAARLAGSRLPVLLAGETGSGKEILARALHERGPRAARRMVMVNCGAIPAQLVESTLFGHERGAFTGAVQQRRGVFEEADGGTVLLDEIGDLPLPAQVALLRVLETGAFSRVGSPREITVDVRVVAATHRDLQAMVAEGRFRADLYFRLDALTLVVPPLRDRAAEIEPLARHFLRAAGEAIGRSFTGFEPEALARLRAHAWPGNVRELRNAVEGAAEVARGPSITLSDLPARVRAAAVATVNAPALEPAPGGPRGAEAGAPVAPAEAASELRSRVQQYEARVIFEALEATGWSRPAAAQRLGMKLRTLRHKIKVLEIRKPERPS